MLRAMLIVLAVFFSVGEALAKEKKADNGPRLKGSKGTLLRVLNVARVHDFTPLRDAAHVAKFARLKLLVSVNETRHLELKRVSYPYARPALALFLTRLSGQYYAKCGERLVVTSLVRPLAEQPFNASVYSVHPMGMAVDFRIPLGACRGWLESVLLSLERRNLADVTRERRPPHYHVALFPKAYETFVKGGKGRRVDSAPLPRHRPITRTSGRE